MLRLIGFFLLVLVLCSVLRQVPVIGAVFAIPFLGFWFTAILLSVVLSRLAVHAVDRRRFDALRRQLGATDTPHNQGKLGSLLLNQGQYRKAIPHLERACEGDPEVAEWHYKLGTALLGARQPEEAVERLERAAQLEEEHAYGGVQLRLAEALTLDGEPDRALEKLDLFARNHGENPESLYRRGLALRQLGRRDEARDVFRRVNEVFEGLVQYQKKEQRKWVFKAFLRGFA